MSADGMTAATDAQCNDDNGSDSSHGRMFTYFSITNTLNQLGNTLVGAASGDQDTESVWPALFW